jgi:hypothetical protein
LAVEELQEENGMTDWLDFAVVMLSSAGVSAVLTAALVWLLRIWIGERMRSAIQAEYAERLETLKAQLQGDAAVKLETYKATLKGQGDAELEKLRAALAIAAVERNQKISGLIQRRFDAIAATYAPLRRLVDATAGYVQVIDLAAESREHLRVAMAKVQADFDGVFDEQRIFLTTPLADQVARIRHLCITAARRFHHHIGDGTDPLADSDEWLKVVERIESDAQLALSALEAGLRALMGDEPDPVPLAPGASTMSGQE